VSVSVSACACDGGVIGDNEMAAESSGLRNDRRRPGTEPKMERKSEERERCAETEKKSTEGEETVSTLFLSKSLPVRGGMNVYQM
jgi:hypothetical protein